jgi:predicted nucleic acid-binding Zn finger protein
MRWYNKAKAAARQGRGKLDPKRVDRALGVLQKKQASPYITTIKYCSCEDYRRHGNPCKHMIAMMIKFRAEKEI